MHNAHAHTQTNLVTNRIDILAYGTKRVIAKAGTWRGRVLGHDMFGSVRVRWDHDSTPRLAAPSALVAVVS